MKKMFFFTTLLTAGTAAAQAQQLANHTLTVNVATLKTNMGAVYVSLQDPEQKPVQRKAIPVRGNTAQVVFQNVPQGTYAVRFYHDENNNQQLDKGAFGIPKEGWGCSNNVRPNFGPPEYQAMLFKLDGNKSINLDVQ